MVNFGLNRNERIYRTQKKLERVVEKLKQAYSAAELSQFLKLEKELEIQKAYQQLENNNG
jgi:capsular polysaccharide biosynthesis protein